MTAHAGVRPRPDAAATARVECRPQRAADHDFLLALATDVSGATFAGLDEALRGRVLRQQLAAQTLSFRACYPEARFDIVELAGAPVGRIVTARRSDALVVVEIAIAAAWRGQGLGTRLIGDVCREAASGGVAVRLRVALANAAARRLYERLGFAATAASELDVTMVRPAFREA